GKLQLERRPCERQSCALFGQVHARCKAHAKGPRPCGMFPMHGQLVCYRHGGKAPNSIAFAKRRQALDAVKSHVSRIVAYDGDDVTSPEEGLLMEVKWSGQVAIAYGEAGEALIADEALTTKSAGAGMQLHALIRGPLACALQRGCTCPNRAQLCRSQGLAQAAAFLSSNRHLRKLIH